MATYKVLQDIEAEDKLIGPLTLRQAVYAGISVLFLYLSFFFATHNAVFMLALFMPVAAAAGFLAFPWGRDQPTEVWALAKVRFMLKPRRRIWDQSGIKELVTITVPKQIAINYTNNLTQEEVRSRLRALADTIDTRGWAIKNAGYSLAQDAPTDSDRLVSPMLVSQPVDDNAIPASEDIMDEKNNANAQRLDSMIAQSSKARRDKIVESLNQSAPKAASKPAKPAADYWFLNQPTAASKVPSNMVTFGSQVVTPGTQTSSGSGLSKTADEASIVAELDKHRQQSSGAYYGHMHTIQPLSKQPAATARPTLPATSKAQSAPTNIPQGSPAETDATDQNASAPVTPGSQAAILQLANNDDLNVATIAREAERSAPQNEVVIKLH